MNNREIIKMIMKEQEVSNSVLAKRLGVTQATLWDRLDTTPRKGKPRKDISVALFSEMLRALDYKVVVVPENARIRDGYVIGEEEAE
jgi:DNA-binding Lrp family transcriptional regulator